MAWKAFIDGGSRGNPGPAAAGVHLLDDSGQSVYQAGFFLGRLTNNQAEYQGMLHALQLLGQAEAASIEIISDSELMVRQINGRYKVKSPGLIPLYQQAVKHLDGFASWSMRHVLRHENSVADAMANLAMDAGEDVVEEDQVGLSARTTEAKRDAPFSQEPHVSDRSASSWTVIVETSPKKDSCSANLRKGQEFTFARTVPSGLCLDGCGAMIKAIQDLRGRSESSIKANCANPGCGARFTIRLG